MPYKLFRNIGIVFLLITASLSGGYYFGRLGFEAELARYKAIPVTVTQRKLEAVVGSKNVSFDELWKVLDILNSKYFLRPLDGKKMLYGAIQGMTESLGDPYTSFLSPKENSDFASSLNGEYEGIGCELGKDDQGIIIVVSPLDGSPAQYAGLKPKDKIIKINGESALDFSLSEAVSKIRGPGGTTVTLNILRGDPEARDNKPFDVTLNREKITIRAVSWKDMGEGVAYLKVSSFGDNTNKEWDTSVVEILRQMPNLKSVIVDVRNNPGGYLSGAVYLGSEFIQNGSVVYQEDANGNLQSLDVDRKGLLTRYPVVVLINGGSASASEILAGALRDRKGAKIVGEKSFGKGTIQDSEDFDDGSSIHVTIAKWLTPNKTWVNKVGLTPDYEVTNDEKDSLKDVQLDKAIEIAKAI
ncbi:peptidase S41 [candidate division WWE3 bacterium CG08_land_8_20_14_0_20_40_13]|uniref:Peptidase S41 n=1 Tax=candidate division WWE3 bacterium CG08_land_8_20_14_0_20_40_13 TaxID=1975084 RepID=A0A2H0XD60_UNCKA|nr:MAG: peptidase S41 [candidate division WWE3 bacterium CG08_land_8_20_14_0_20_40_13]